MSKESTSATVRPLKRKAGQDEHKKNGGVQKRPRFEHASKQRDARAIITQPSFKAFKRGELDVDKFVQSREFEIRALERGLVNSKKALTKRAFQLVPRELRRRTASHNVQRVPKRLRKRARKEMKEDNTPTVTAKKRKPTGHMRLRLETAKKLRTIGRSRSTTVRPDSAAALTLLTGIPKHGTKSRVRTRSARVKSPHLSTAPVTKAKFRKRQKEKAWLPTHLFHAKRARMTPPSQTLWRFALPLTPTAKSYRSTHRVASEQGALAWDTSYFSTIQLSGKRSSLNIVLRELGVEQQLSRLRKHQLREWLLGRTVLEVNLYEIGSFDAMITPATLIWAPDTIPTETQPASQSSMLWARVHPAAFLQLWKTLLCVSKLAKPHVTVVDLRFEIGSVEVVGQEAADALLSVLWPSMAETDDATETTNDGLFFRRLAGVNDAAILDPGTVLSFQVDDPRLHFPPRRSSANKTQLDATALLEMNTARITGQRLGHTLIFNKEKRFASCCRLASQKALDRRRRAAPPGQLPAKRETDPRVPILMFTSPITECKKRVNHWTVLLPWKWVQSVWYCLMYSPLPSGAQPRFGGLDELRSLSLERGRPSFPADYPTASAGWAWELQERERQHSDWARRPKSKRVNWDTLAISKQRKGEIGIGWACDWHRLLIEDEHHVNRDKQTASASNSETEKPRNMLHVSGYDAEHYLQGSSQVSDLYTNALVTVRIDALLRGVPQLGARIYKLPRSGELRRRWLQQHPSLRSKRQTSQARLPALDKTAPAHELRRRLAKSLLTPIDPGHDMYPDCPGEEDLIGFVTTGNYDLGAGRGMAIGSLSLRRVRKGWSPKQPDSGFTDESSRLCIVRNSGQTIGRLASWELIM